MEYFTATHKKPLHCSASYQLHRKPLISELICAICEKLFKWTRLGGGICMLETVEKKISTLIMVRGEGDQILSQLG